MSDDNIKMVPLDSIDTDADPKHYYFELPEGLIDRIKAFKIILREVELIPLTETIENFKYDSNPEKEVAMWETIAEVYKDYVAENPDLSIEEKMEVYKVAFVSCSMPLQFDKLGLNFLSMDEASAIQRSINLQLKSKIGKMFNPITVTSQHTDEEIIESIYPAVRKYILTQEIAKASEIQRLFLVGFELAAKLLDKLEEDGLTEKAKARVQGKSLNKPRY